MATTLSYSVSDFTPFTKIRSADVNSRFTDIRNRLNYDGTSATGLGDDNLQSNTVSGGGLTRNTKLKAGTANYVVINDSNGKMSEEATLATARGGLGFAPTVSAANAGKVVGVNDAGSALELRSTDAGVLVQALHNTISGITAAEAITSNDAVCLILNEGTYKWVKADGNDPTRNVNYMGFALNSGTVTPQISTIDITGTWTSGTAIITVNGRQISQAFSTNHNTSVDALATALQNDQDIATCVANGGRTQLTVTSEGGLSLTITITQQPTGATFGSPNQTQAASGSNMRVQIFGALSGFSGLTTGNLYYLSDTAGAITSAPSTAGIAFVGQALSSTVLLISPNKFNFVLPGTGIYLRVLGSTDHTVGNGVLDVEHFNLSTWSSGTSAASRRIYSGAGDSAYNSLLHVVDGAPNSSETSEASLFSYNRSAWATLTARSTGYRECSVGVIGGVLHANKGSTDNTAGNGSTTSSKWNSASWASGTAFATASTRSPGTFIYSTLMSVVGGYSTGGSAQNLHETKNSSDVLSSSTVLPASGYSRNSSSGSSSGFIANLGDATNVTTAYIWTGSWSSSTNASYSISGMRGNASAYSSASTLAIFNGGYNNTANVANTCRFNGSSFSSDTSSNNARAAGAAAFA